MNILITGVSGFVGPILAKKIKKNFKDCKLFGTYYLHDEFDSISHLTFDKIYMNILDQNSIKSVLKSTKPDLIFHLAAQSSVRLSWENPMITMDVNVNGTVNLIKSLAEMEFKPRILFIGSSEQYGLVDNKPIRETRICKPANPYGLSKKVQEDIAQMLSFAHDLDVVFTRSFNHIGILQVPTFVIPDWCKQIAEIEHGLREPVIYVGNTEVIRDFSDVNDVCESYIDVIKHGKRNEVYNIGSGRGLSLTYILEYLIGLSSKKIKVKIDQKRLRPSENPIIICDNSKLQSLKKQNYMEIESVFVEIFDYWKKKIYEDIKNN